MAETILFDNFRQSGTELEEFATSTKYMADITKSRVIRGRDVTFLSLYQGSDEKYLKEGCATFYILSDEYVKNFSFEFPKFYLAPISYDKISEELVEELKKTTGLACKIGDDYYAVSSFAMHTLTQRGNVGGDMFVQKNGFIRDLHLADVIFSCNDNCHFVIREENGFKKIFASLGAYFAPVPQTVLTSIIDEINTDGTMGKPVVRRWNIQHDFTEIYVEFPEAAEDFKRTYKLDKDIVPGCYICTSDIGFSSIIVRGTYSFGGSSYVVTDEVAFKHTKNVTSKNIVAKVDVDIFAKIRKLPETLIELIGIEVTDYSKIDISTEAGGIVNTEAMRSIYDYILRAVEKSNRTALFGEKRLNELLNCLVDEINSSIPYTMYDIAMIMLNLADRIVGFNDTVRLQKALAKVPYMLLKCEPYSPSEDEGSITLLP